MVLFKPHERVLPMRERYACMRSGKAGIEFESRIKVLCSGLVAVFAKLVELG